MNPNIKICRLTGSAIKTYIPSFSKLRIKALKEFPCLRHNNLEEDQKYLHNLARCNESIAVIIFDGSKIIGMSTGIPIEKEHSLIQNPLLQKSYNLSSIYYFTAPILLKKYQGRGIIHHFFEIQEQHVCRLKRFKKICFNVIQKSTQLSERSKDDFPLDSFWRKRGYIEHTDLILSYPWGQTHIPLLSLIYWIKNL